jgi:hypothetical protein
MIRNPIKELRGQKEHPWILSGCFGKTLKFNPGQRFVCQQATLLCRQKIANNRPVRLTSRVLIAV